MNSKKNKNLFLVVSVVMIFIGVFIYFFLNNKKITNNAENNSAVQEISTNGDKIDIKTEGDSSKAGFYENKKAGISFSYPESYKVTKDELGTGNINSKLILNDTKKGTSITVYQNIHGLNPQFSDFIYYMSKQGNSFIISQRIDGEVPEKDTESFSIIANFGDAAGTSKVNGKSMIMIFNSKPSNTFEDDFKSVVTSLKEIN